jgi:hypothetical protein
MKEWLERNRLFGRPGKLIQRLSQRGDLGLAQKTGAPDPTLDRPYRDPKSFAGGDEIHENASLVLRVARAF